MAVKRSLDAQDDEPEQKRMKPGTLKDCWSCGESKTLDQYSANRQNVSTGLRPDCKACVSIKNKKYYNTHSGFFKSLINSTKTRTAAMRKRGRNLNSTMTEEKVKKILKDQNGKCAISGAILVFKRFSNNQASIDRIKDNLGYVDGNCRLVCLEFNTRVKWSRKLLVKAVSLSGIPPENFESETSGLEEDLQGGQRIGTIEKEWTQVTKNGISVIFCHHCSATKPRTEFGKVIADGCKDCKSQNNKDRRSKWRGALQELILSAKNHTTIRNKRRKKGTLEQKFKLTYLELVKILKAQGGMCAYSRIALSPKMGDWKISLERKDVTKGYSADNVCLVCQGFNGIDWSGRNAAAEGSGGWSREKFLQYAQLVS